MLLGIEIGGTKLQMGIGAGDGTLRGLWRDRVDPSAGAEGIRRQIVAALPALLETAGIERDGLLGAGVGFGGPVDDQTRCVIKSHQVSGWSAFPLADWLTEATGLPVALGNDADAAGLAEALFGAGKGLSPIFYITIGSGIGGGLIINGEVYRGCGRGAAEIGHLRIYDPLELFENETTGFGPTLEEQASGWAIARNGRLHAAHAPTLQAALDAGGRITAETVAEAARRGEFHAEHILWDALWTLAKAVNEVITLLCPRRIIVGGGVSLMGEELLFEPLRRVVRERVFEPFRDCYDIVPAALGEEVVVHGALALARKRFVG